MKKQRITTVGRTEETIRLLTSVKFDEEFSINDAHAALGGGKRGITDRLVRYTVKELELIGALQATKEMRNGKVIMRYRLVGDVARRMILDACIHMMIATKVRAARLQRM